MQQDSNNGQIHLDTEFGDYLSTVASDPQYKTYLEVGTWKGNGSTRCVIEGILKRPEETMDNVHFYSIESNLNFFAEAFQLWLPSGLPFLHLCYGKLHENGLMTPGEIESSEHFNGIVTHYNMWYIQDCKDYAAAPFLKPKYFPKEIDVVILDGGEFSGYADWLSVKEKNPKVVCLDDTTVMKNKHVYLELKNSEQWEILYDNPSHRHGWAAFRRKP